MSAAIATAERRASQRNERSAHREPGGGSVTTVDCDDVIRKERKATKDPAKRLSFGASQEGQTTRQPSARAAGGLSVFYLGNACHHPLLHVGGQRSVVEGGRHLLTIGVGPFQKLDQLASL